MISDTLPVGMDDDAAVVELNPFCLGHAECHNFEEIGMYRGMMEYGCYLFEITSRQNIVNYRAQSLLILLKI